MAMRKIMILSFLSAILLISCQQEDITPVVVDHVKIPIDSFYLSCRINGKDYVFESPKFAYDSGSSFHAVLNGKSISRYDSVMLGYSRGYYSGKCSVKVCLSDFFMIDTSETKDFFMKVMKDRLYKIGYNHMQYFPIGANLYSDLRKCTGLCVKIDDYETNMHFTSYYPNWCDYNNDELYNYFKSNSSFVITKLIKLDSGIYSDYENSYYIESSFTCPMFEYNNYNQSYSTKQLSLGVIRGVF